MSTPRRLELDSSVRRTATETSRGAFATLLCPPAGSSLPRGNAIVLPGFTGSKEDFGELLPLLADVGWQVATYDQRGQFETSGGPDDDFSLEGYAADLVAVAETLFGLEERVHLVGHSFGGLVASTAAVAEPDRWASLTLMCSGPGGFVDTKGAEAREGAAQIERDGLEQAYAFKVRRDLERGRPAPAEEVAGFLHHRFLSNSSESLAAMARLLASAPDLTSSLADIGIPVAVLRGEDDDAWSHEVQDALAEALGTSVVVIGEAAHSPAVEQPEATRDALARIWMS